MQGGKWDATAQAMMVIEGLKDKPVTEIRIAHQISQPQYSERLDQFLNHSPPC